MGATITSLFVMGLITGIAILGAWVVLSDDKPRTKKH